MLCLTRLQGVDLGKRRGQGSVEFALTCFITHVLSEYDSRLSLRLLLKQVVPRRTPHARSSTLPLSSLSGRRA